MYQRHVCCIAVSLAVFPSDVQEPREWEFSALPRIHVAHRLSSLVVKLQHKLVWFSGFVLRGIDGKILLRALGADIAQCVFCQFSEVIHSSVVWLLRFTPSLSTISDICITHSIPHSEPESDTCVSMVQYPNLKMFFQAFLLIGV